MEAAADWILEHLVEAEEDWAIAVLHAPSVCNETVASGKAGASSSEQPKEPVEKFPDGHRIMCGHYVPHVKRVDG